MASASLEKEPQCSICLSLYTDPVSLRCGHNFCRECIDRVLNTEDGSGVYSCPDCREELQERPTLKRNITLCNVVENFWSDHKNTSILCTYCIHSPVPAVRSCLHCEASLCDNHLRVHSKGPEHVLTDPSTSLENRKCSVHKKILEYYCTEDAACICVSCSLIGEHQGHKLEALDEAFRKKREELKNVLQKLIANREKTEETVWSLEECRKKAKASGAAERVTVLFMDISRREEQISLSLPDAIQKLEMKKDELSRKMRHIEELCNMTDPLTVLQDPDTGDLCDPEEEEGDEETGGHDGGDEATGRQDGGDEATGRQDGGDEATGRQDGGDEATGRQDGGDEATGRQDGGDEATGRQDGGDEATGRQDGGDEATGRQDGGDEATGRQDGGDEDTGRYKGDRGAKLIPHKTHKLSDIIRGVNLTFYIQDPADILLDVNTVHKLLIISNDLKTATETEKYEDYTERAERFQDFEQVMSRSGFTSGRHYWDVEISVVTVWSVGMCYPSIDRINDHSLIGGDPKSWALLGGHAYNHEYSVMHNCNQIMLGHEIPSDGVRIRICLDYEAGQLSFYELCDPIRHLHTFTAAFSEPLHAALLVYDGYMKILGGSSS